MSIQMLRFAAVGDRFLNALTLVDLDGEDMPLIYVNNAFVAMTGYQRQDIIGRNCRFLQGPDTNKTHTLYLRKAIEQHQAIYCDLVNYRKNGEKFYNRLVLMPLSSVIRRYYIGMQIDVSGNVARGLVLGNSFDDLEMSDSIRDGLNTPLMKIQSVLALEDPLDQSGPILDRAFAQILATVKSLPHYG